MDGVRTVAGIFLVMGWIMVMIGGLAALLLLTTFSTYLTLPLCAV